jgi:transposase
MYAQFSEGTIEKLEKSIREECDGKKLRKMQVVLLGAKCFRAHTVATMTQYKEGYVRELWMKYRKKGEEIFVSGNTKTRNNAHFSEKEEVDFLSPFLEKAKKAGILIATDVHIALEEKVGKKIPIGTTYNLLHRHGWRKIVPRPYHPKRDSEKREAWKASFPPSSTSSKRGSKEKRT